MLNSNMNTFINKNKLPRSQNVDFKILYYLYVSYIVICSCKLPSEQKSSL